MATRIRWLLHRLALLALWPGAVHAQQPATLTGRVTGEAGQPLVGVAVGIAALDVGAVTRPDGGYTLTVPGGRLGSGQTVQVTASMLGRRTQVQTAALRPGASATLDFQLPTDVLQLEGIVATGAGTATTRERLGVSIASVGAEELTRVATPNVVNAIAAKAAGVQVQSTSGEPGASAYIRIRGVNTIAGSGQPLFVVDGVPVSNDEVTLPSSLLTIGGTSEEPVALSSTVQTNRAADINAADIQSVEILKGAAASAIYGARAANGVVLITTRRGQPGQTRVSLSTTSMLDQVTRAYPLQRTFAQGVGGVSGLNLRSWGAPIAGRSYDHWSELFEDGRALESNLSVSGGGERTTYYLTVGGLDHDGVIDGGNDFYDRKTARLSGSHRLLESLSVSGNFAYAQTEGGRTQRGSNTAGLLLGGLRTPPSFDNLPYLTEQGFHRNYTNPEPGAVDEGGTFDNPFWVIHQNLARSEVARAYGNVTLDWQALEWLKLSYTLGNDYSNDERLDRFPIGNAIRASGYLQQATLTNQQIDQNALATLGFAPGDALAGSLTLGWNRNSRSFRRFFAEGFDFVAENLFTLDNVLTTTPDNYRYRIHSESFFGQLQTDLWDRLFLTAALRNDGFSTFGESEKRHWYPKLSAAWDVGRTLGWEEMARPLLSYAKLRAAWGQAGNEPPVYGTVGGLTAAALLDGGWGTNFVTTALGQGGVYTSVTRGQPALKPERTSELELGVDLSLLDDLATLGVTWYNARTEDAILNAQVSPSTGFFQQLRNAATLRNRGVEVSLDVRPLRSARLAWEIGGTWARNDNRVLSLGDSATEFVRMFGGFAGATGAAYRGSRVGVLQGNDFARCGRGLVLNGVDVDAGCGGAPEGALYVAASGFPIFDPTLRIIGDPHPDWTAGLRNTLTLFDRVQLYALLDIRRGGDVWNGTRGTLYSYGTHQDTEARAACTAPAANSAAGCSGNEQVFGQGILPGPVAGPGAGRAVPIGENWWRVGLGTSFNNVNSQFMEDGGYVKLREVALGYTLPTSVVRRLGMSGVDLRLAGRNLATWTDYTGLDPETNTAGGTNLRGVDYFNNPQTRQWILTVNLNR